MILGLICGVNVAWAQTTLYYRTLTGTESNPADAAEQAWSASDIGTGKWETVSGTPTIIVTEEETVVGLKSDGKGDISNSTQITPTANKMLVIDAVWVYGGSSYTTDAHLNIGSNITIKANPKSQIGSVIFNGSDTRSITNAHSTSAGTRASDTWTIHVVINTVTNKVTALTVTGASETKTASYTLRGEVALTGTPTYNVFTTGQDYYKDADNKGYVILKSLKVSEETPYAYSVVWKSGDAEMGTFASGYDINGASKAFPYYGYLCKDNVLYKNSTFVGSKSFTLTENPQTEYITGYTAQNVGFVVYCEEAENIGGMTLANTNAMDSRCSGKQSAYCTEDVTITTLPAGTYNISAGIQGNGTSTFVVKAGETAKLNLENESSSYREEKSTGTFTIDATTDIKVNGGNSSVAFDNFYIVCQSVKAPVTAAKFATFANTVYPLNFDDVVDAYTVTLDGTSLSFNKIEGAVVAGTPVLLHAPGITETTNYIVPVASTTSANSPENLLIVCDGNELDRITYDYYGLKSLGDNKVGFAKLSNTLNPSAGKVVLRISKETPVRDFIIPFDESTGINSVVSVDNQYGRDHEYFNLQGQRVENPTTGLYIVNGKKILKK